MILNTQWCHKVWTPGRFILSPSSGWPFNHSVLCTEPGSAFCNYVTIIFAGKTAHKNNVSGVIVWSSALISNIQLPVSTFLIANHREQTRLGKQYV